MPGDWRFIVAARSLDAVRMRCCLRIGYRATDAAGISTRRIPDILILEMNDAFILKTAVDALLSRQLVQRQAITQKAVVTEWVKCEAVDFSYRSLAVTAP